MRAVRVPVPSDSGERRPPLTSACVALGVAVLGVSHGNGGRWRPHPWLSESRSPANHGNRRPTLVSACVAFGVAVPAFHVKPRPPLTSACASLSEWRSSVSREKEAACEMEAAPWPAHPSPSASGGQRSSETEAAPGLRMRCFGWRSQEFRLGAWAAWPPHGSLQCGHRSVHMKGKAPLATA
jgi:hypothetical protein